MPDCPKCKTDLALTVAGGICPVCRQHFTVKQVENLPGYDSARVEEQLELFAMLNAAGLLRGGINTVDICEDGLIITNLNEPN